MDTGNILDFLISDNLNKSTKKECLCVVMPAYNEAMHIRENLLKASQIISGFVHNYRIIVVNDGSSDNTLEEIISASNADSKISYISYKPNQGKGKAITNGVLYANSEYLAFLDSDLELNPSMLKSFLKAMKDNNADIVIGSKLHKDSKLEYPLTRRIMSIGYYIVLKILFRLEIKDTQTGIKLFRTPVIKSLTSDMITDGYAYDIEILAKANKAGCKIIEMPIELKFKRERKEKSRISFKTSFKVFKDTIKIKKSLM
ncbi:MAG: glycosyltransferase family 2 protein [Lachnospiraceae bacterium]|nr:glycosyltransferase family 2 protein [Lachnospiraceae bacterium]MBQ9233892.1 glycosyltransferase family 2 protein [Lachnospiraceae bacterium]